MALAAAADRPLAVTFTNVHSFSYSDGARPQGLIVAGSVLYGTTELGGSTGDGSIYSMRTDGSGFKTLYNFSAASASGTNGDGFRPNGPLFLSGNTLYGTALGGGAYDEGTVFRINTDGSGFTNLHNFSGPPDDGDEPGAGVIVAGKMIYGATLFGGLNSVGLIYAMDTNGNNFLELYSFSPGFINDDGDHPSASLILSGGTLYGTAKGGGSGGQGTVFAVQTDGFGFTNLHSFAQGDFNSLDEYTNADGSEPAGSLLILDQTLYGTTDGGGSGGNGTVFSMGLGGGNFTNLYDFPGYNDDNDTNADGADIQCGLALSGNTLYGVAPDGGPTGNGTVWSVGTDGTAFTVLHAFLSPNTFSANPEATMAMSANTLYGTTFYGGDNGRNDGAVFALVPGPTPIFLTIQRTGQSAVLQWNDSSYSLQTASTVTGAYTNVPGAISPYTNSAAASEQFFRLKQ